jgi:hypothetical protein
MRSADWLLKSHRSSTLLLFPSPVKNSNLEASAQSLAFYNFMIRILTGRYGTRPVARRCRARCENSKPSFRGVHGALGSTTGPKRVVITEKKRAKMDAGRGNLLKSRAERVLKIYNALLEARFPRGKMCGPGEFVRKAGVAENFSDEIKMTTANLP